MARLIHEALVQLGWEGDPQALADRVRRLNVGLPREEEFAVVCTWLGRCSLVHKLEQAQAPVTSRNEYQVPDLFAVFTIGERRMPVLIEVKSSNDRTLSFRPDYLQRLRNYAALLELPLLIAWKHEGIWALFDSGRLEKAERNFNITLGVALQDSLLSILAGDFSYQIGAGAGIHLRFRKEQLLNEKRTETGNEQEWKTTCDGVWFTDRDGNVRDDLSPEVQSLFLTWDLKEATVESETHLTHSFVVEGAEGGVSTILFAHMALVRMLNFELPKGREINWREMLGKAQLLRGISDFTVAVRSALREGVVKYVFHTEPRNRPGYLAIEST